MGEMQANTWGDLSPNKQRVVVDCSMLLQKEQSFTLTKVRRRAQFRLFGTPTKNYSI